MSRTSLAPWQKGLKECPCTPDWLDRKCGGNYDWKIDRATIVAKVRFASYQGKARNLCWINGSKLHISQSLLPHCPQASITCQKSDQIQPGHSHPSSVTSLRQLAWAGRASRYYRTCGSPCGTTQFESLKVAPTNTSLWGDCADQSGGGKELVRFCPRRIDPLRRGRSPEAPLLTSLRRGVR